MQQLTLKIVGPSRNESAKVRLDTNQILTIGRKECVLNLEDQRVSRQHLSIAFEGGVVVIEDLKSHNGTLLNGKRLTKARLNDGDVIRVGDHTITIGMEDSVSQHEVQMEPAPDAAPDFPEAPSADIPVQGEFWFYVDRKIDWRTIQKTYIYAVRNWRSFWTDVDYQIPFENSVPVLAVFAATFGLLGLVNGRGLAGVIAGIGIVATTIGFVIGLAAVMGSLKEWLKLKGDFREFVAFGIYASFLYFPICMVGVILGKGVFFILGSLFSIWAVWGFIRAFQPNPIRFVGLMAGVVVTILSSLGLVGYVIYRLFRVSD